MDLQELLDALCLNPTNVRDGRVEDGRGSLGPFGHRPVSHPRSSNRTCRSPASGFPTGFTVRHTESKLTARGFGAASNSPSPLDTAISGGACHLWCLQADRKS